MVSRLDDVQVVLDDHKGVPCLDELLEGRQQHDVIEMQSGRRLVENVEQSFSTKRRQMRGNLDALRLAMDSVVAG